MVPCRSISEQGAILDIGLGFADICKKDKTSLVLQVMERTRNIQQFSGVEAVAASEDVVCPDWFPHAAFMLLIQHELGCSANQEPQSSGQWADLMGDREQVECVSQCHMSMCEGNIMGKRPGQFYGSFIVTNI